jgi:dihydrofolate reductase
MPKVIVYVATSQDGYIADEKGCVSWLPQELPEACGRDYGYRDFYASIDALAIGKRTYETILSSGTWPYADKFSFIFSSQSSESKLKGVEFVYKDVVSFLNKIKDQNIKNLWLMGGTRLTDAFYEHGRIDEFIITVFPTVLGNGVSLKILEQTKDKLKLTHSVDYGNGVVQNHYVLA